MRSDVQGRHRGGNAVWGGGQFAASATLLGVLPLRQQLCIGPPPVLVAIMRGCTPASKENKVPLSLHVLQ